MLHEHFNVNSFENALWDNRYAYHFAELNLSGFNTLFINTKH